MKSLVLAAGVAFLLVPHSAAKGAVMTLGGPMSRLCYQSALSRDSRPLAMENCDRSLSEESMTAPDRAATYVNRGILHMVRGHLTDADADFNQAIKLDTRLSDAWLNKGFLRLRAGNGREALPLLEEGIKLGPRREALAVFARGVAYEQMGEFRSAYADLRRARDLEPGWNLPGQYLARYRVESAR
jgi:tetratricopeptide (TPR) repeat protein